MDAGLGRIAVAYLLADALEDQHVRVHGHAHREHDAGDAGQRERGLQQRQHGHDQHQIQGQRQIGDQAEHLVVKGHEDQHQHKADDHRIHALIDIILAEAGADGALLNDIDRRGQRAGAQQQRQRARLLGGIQAGNLKAAAELFADHGGVDHLLDRALDLSRRPVLLDGFKLVLDKHHGQLLAHIVAGAVCHAPRALAIQIDGDIGAARGRVDAGGRVGDRIAGQQHLPAEQDRQAVTVIIEFGTGRDLAINGVPRVMLLIDQAKFQRGRRAEDLLGAGGVLHARQLHHHPV